jgi:flagellar protein FlaG
MSDLNLNSYDKGAVSPSVIRDTTASSGVRTKAEEIGKSGKVLPPSGDKVEALSKEQVQDAVSRINEYVQQSERTLDFQLDEDSGKTIISVYDTQSSELIRQIPSELALELARKLNDEEPSLLFSAQV